MDIHIIRDGTTIGPFPEETVETLLKQGKLAITDLAWCNGIPQWVPLANLLYASATRPPPPGSGPPPPPDVGGEIGAAGDGGGESATDKQKAFLTYMGIPFDREITKKAASLLVNDVFENSPDPARLARWSEARLKLHPDLFAAEVEARKESRPERFFEICQTEGAEFFTSVTKAHCQVLVGFLDVTFPNWDSDEREGTWNYFFPAIAEKFPQLASKEAMARFQYPAGRRGAAAMLSRSPTSGKTRRSFSLPVSALARGVFFGLLVLGVLWFGRNLFQGRDPSAGPSVQTSSEDQSTSANPTSPASMHAVEDSAEPPALVDAPALQGMTDLATDSDNVSPAPSEDSPPLFGPDMSVGRSVSTGAASLAPPPLSAAPARTSLLLTKAVEVQLAYGKIKLPPGTPVKLLQRDGSLLKVSYLNSTLTVPASSTDVGSDASPQAVAPSPPASGILPNHAPGARGGPPTPNQDDL